MQKSVRVNLEGWEITQEPLRFGYRLVQLEYAD